MIVAYKNGIKLLVPSNSKNIKEQNKNEAKLIIDNSQSESEIKKDKGIFYIYENLYLNQNFEENLNKIINNVYEYNDETLFRFFLIKKQKFATYKIVEFVNHLTSYPTLNLKLFNTKVYKNTGLIFSFDLYLVFAQPFDLKTSHLSNFILKSAIENTAEINKNFHQEHFNTHFFVKDQFNISDELFLIIHYEFEPKFNKLNQFTMVDKPF